MLQRIDRLAPESPYARLAIGFVAAGAGVPLAAYTLYGLVVTLGNSGYTGSPEIAAVALVGLALSTVGYHLARGVADQASAAPRESNPARVDRNESTDQESDPVTVLQRRYAAGELDEDELDRRMDRLLATESEAPDRAERAKSHRLVE